MRKPPGLRGEREETRSARTISATRRWWAARGFELGTNRLKGECSTTELAARCLWDGSLSAYGCVSPALGAPAAPHRVRQPRSLTFPAFQARPAAADYSPVRFLRGPPGAHDHTSHRARAEPQPDGQCRRRGRSTSSPPSSASPPAPSAPAEQLHRQREGRDGVDRQRGDLAADRGGPVAVQEHASQRVDQRRQRQQPDERLRHVREVR